MFACAFDWPGWCRSGRDEDSALAALREYLPRYAVAVGRAHVRKPSSDLEVVEHVRGSATTDFGAPGAIADRDGEALSAAELRRVVALVEAAWLVFDDVVAAAPAELQKGPRGGGRDRDKIVDHVYGAEVAYASRMGLKLRQPARGGTEAVAAFRAAVLDALRSPVAGAKWPTRYAARRVAWHALDHAWEIEDRST